MYSYHHCYDMDLLTCPVCGKSYNLYKEYFACWTGHLEEKYTGKNSVGTMPFDHKDAIMFIKENPQYLEVGLRVIAVEFGVFHGRIDLIGVDREKRIVLIDVDSGHDLGRKVRQLQRYRKALQHTGTQVFGLSLVDMPKIRLLIVNPNKYIKDVSDSCSL